MKSFQPLQIRFLFFFQNYSIMSTYEVEAILGKKNQGVLLSRVSSKTI